LQGCSHEISSTTFTTCEGIIMVLPLLYIEKALIVVSWLHLYSFCMNIYIYIWLGFSSMNFLQPTSSQWCLNIAAVCVCVCVWLGFSLMYNLYIYTYIYIPQRAALKKSHLRSHCPFSHSLSFSIISQQFLLMGIVWWIVTMMLMTLRMNMRMSMTASTFVW